MDTYINRPVYLEQLKRLKDTQLIKVVTGMRRCGKSTLFELYIRYLKSIGVKESQIIHLNLEDPLYFSLRDYKDFYNLISEKIITEQMYYLFIDEVQQIPLFEKVVSGLLIKKNIDIYLTGSNAFLLSGELATLLSGRYVEIKMLPLSFAEYRSALKEPSDLNALYQQYVNLGSLPYVLQLKTTSDVLLYLEGVYASVIMKDIVMRYNIRDVAILEDVIRFMFDNIGNLSSSNNISATLTSKGRKTSVPTVETYLKALTDSFVLYKVGRYDIKGKKYLSTGNKYYISELGLRRYLLGERGIDYGHILENVVFLELKRRGFEVYVGYQSQGEVDFVTFKEGLFSYYQVAYTIMGNDGETLKRELRPLLSIQDQYPKYLLTMDMLPPSSHEGVKQLNVLSWLLDNN
jgi:predicted AAA+ superfamily ATPase